MKTDPEPSLSMGDGRAGTTAAPQLLLKDKRMNTNLWESHAKHHCQEEQAPVRLRHSFDRANRLDWRAPKTAH